MSGWEKGKCVILWVKFLFGCVCLGHGDIFVFENLKI